MLPNEIDQLSLVMQEIELETNRPPRASKSIKAECIRQLFQNTLKNRLNEYIKILEEHGFIRYIDAQQFIKYINERIPNCEGLGQFIQNFQQFHRGSQENEKRKLYYPIIVDQQQNGRDFVKRKLMRFIAKYEEENNSLANYETGQLFYAIPAFNEGQSQNQEKKHQVSQTVLRKSQNLTFMDVSLQFRDRQSISTLLQINVTQYFKDEFEQVKSIIRNQISSGTKIIKTYQSFLLQFLQLYYIRQGYCQNDFEDEQKEKIQEEIKNLFQTDLTQQNGQRILYFWKKIYKNLQYLLKDQEKDLKNQIKSIILDYLQKIFLTINRSIGLYGCTYYQAIFINIYQNINQIQRIIPYQYFRQSLVKPYISLVIYHQIAHALVRQKKGCHIRGSESSFTSKTKSIGNQIINSIRLIQKIPKYLCLAPKQKIKDHFYDAIIFVKKIFQQKKQLFQIIQKYQNDLKEIKVIVESFSFVFQNIYGKLQVRDLKNQWKSVYAYIDELQKYHKQVKQVNDEDYQNLDQKQLQYRIFFSFLLTQPIALTWIDELEQQQQIYHYYKDKLRKIKAKKYYISENTPINLFIKQDIFNQFKQQDQEQGQKSKSDQYYYINSDLQKFIACTLFAETPLEDLSSKINKIFQEFGLNNLALFMLQVNLNWSNLSIVFNNGLQIHGMRQTQINNFSFFLKNKLKVSQTKSIFLIKEYYDILSEIIKYSPIFQIIYQLPSFFSNTNSKTTKGFQSGYDMQKRLFQKTQIQFIYAKDYELIKNIQFSQKARKSIGNEPIQQNEKKLSLKVGRQSRLKSAGLSLKGKYCGNYLSYLNRAAKEQLKKQAYQNKRANNNVGI